MSLSELGFLVTARDGAQCVSFKIPNPEVPHFQQFAASKDVRPRVVGKGREMSTVYVCAKPDADGKENLSPLKEFLKVGVPVFVAEENNPLPQTSAA